MSQGTKSSYYQALKEVGVTFDKHYRDYSTEELREAYDALGDAAPPLDKPEPEPVYDRTPLPQQVAPRIPKDPNEMPGQRLNSQGDAPIREDEQGRLWFQEEVAKPSYAKPRGRRVYTYTETGTKTVSAKEGDYTETFEVAGEEEGRTAQVKITLPSYQVGTFLDPRFPFKIHTYGGQNGFDLFEVQDYWNGAELVPESVKRIYVENVLCYDIRTTVRAIEAEYRHLQLTGQLNDE